MLNNQHQPVRFGIGDRAGPLASLAKAVSISETASRFTRNTARSATVSATRTFVAPSRSLMQAMPFEDVLTTITTVVPNCQSRSNRSWDLLPRPGGGR